MNGPQWETTALFLVWDEWCGFYDHVEPLTERDARASDMLDCFDFDRSPLPPLRLEPRTCPA